MAVTVSVEEFRTIYTSFADFSDEVVQIYLDYAASFVGLDRRCLRTDANRKAAIYALTAHLLFMLRLGNNGQAGALTSASEGSVSAGFTVPIINNNSWYSESPFGRLFWQIMAPCRAGGAQFTPWHNHPWG